MPIMIPPDVASNLLEHAADLGTDNQGNRIYHIPVPMQPDEYRALLHDIRHLGRSSDLRTTVWQAPQLRALLMASEGSANLIFYAQPGTYREATQGVQRGLVPEPSLGPVLSR